MKQDYLTDAINKYKADLLGKYKYHHRQMRKAEKAGERYEGGLEWGMREGTRSAWFWFRQFQGTIEVSREHWDCVCSSDKVSA